MDFSGCDEHILINQKAVMLLAQLLLTFGPVVELQWNGSCTGLFIYKGKLFSCYVMVTCASVKISIQCIVYAHIVSYFN